MWQGSPKRNWTLEVVIESYNLGQKCWDNCWKQDYFSQIGGSCKIPSPLLPHSMLNKKFHPRATLYGGGGVWLKVLTRCLPTFKLNIRVLCIVSRGFVRDCSQTTVPADFYIRFKLTKMMVFTGGSDSFWQRYCIYTNLVKMTQISILVIKDHLWIQQVVFCAI